MNAVLDIDAPGLAGAITRKLLGPSAAVAACTTDGSPGALFPQEEVSVRRASIKRQREFAAGRGAARRAIAELEMPPSAIPMRDDRAPQWPPGLVGSITHCDEICIAAVSRNVRARSIGIDIEPSVPLDANLLDIVCTPTERKWLDKQHTRARFRLAKLIFSAKEAAYKAQYPLTGLAFDFHRLEVELDATERTFTARLTQGNRVFPTDYKLRGKFSVEGGWIITAVTIQPLSIGY